MGRYDDINPQDIAPATGAPYSNYSSPALEPFTDDEWDDEPTCSDRRGHRWVCSDENEEISYCQWCGADGNG